MEARAIGVMSYIRALQCLPSWRYWLAWGFPHKLIVALGFEHIFTCKTGSYHHLKESANIGNQSQ